MRKFIIAIFLALIMMLVPLNSIGQTNVIANNQQIQEDEMPSFYITESDNVTLNIFIENNFIGQEKIDAKALKDNIIETDLEVNVSELANKLSLYIYEPIPPEDLEQVLTNNDRELLDSLLEQYWGVTEGGFIENLFSTLLIKIFEMIQNRLGWIYKLVTDGISLIYNGIDLFVNVVKEKILVIAWLFVSIINYVLTFPQKIINAIKELFQADSDPQKFLDIISGLIDDFNVEIYNFINQIELAVTNESILNYINQAEEFIIWFDSDPWTDPIHITGDVKSFSLKAQEGIIVSCRDDSIETDSNGKFDFYARPNPDSNSIPAGKFYGMHDCTITISNDEGELKSTIKLLSYCFSGGSISWNFLIRTAKAKNIDERPIILNIIQNIINKIKEVFPNIFKLLDEIVVTKTTYL